MLSRRIISGVLFLVVVALAAFWLPSIVGVLLLLALAVVGLMEFYQLVNLAGMPAFRVLGGAAAVALLASTYVTLNAAQLAPDALPAFLTDLEWVVLFAIVFAVCIRQFPQKNNAQPLGTIGGTLFGVFYAPFLLGFVLRLLFRWDPVGPWTAFGPTGRALVLYLIVVVKGSDIGAYFAGRFLGRHKLFPRVSPGKTWEGLAGGMLAAVAASLVFCALLPASANAPGAAAFGRISMTHVDALVLGVLLAAVGVVGDLVESLLKRAANAKDSGGLVPGMGGVLDVLDSLLFAAPVLYVYAGWFLKGDAVKKRVVILGSAGSIGESALRVIEALPERFEVVGLGVRRNTQRLLEQAARFGTRQVAVSDPAAADACAAAAPAGLTVLKGDAGLEALAYAAKADLVLCAVVGMAGLRPVLAALERGLTVALATKEVLVAAGPMVMDACRWGHARLLPVDSEHSAIFQCLEGRDPAGVRRLVLTASGGPFSGKREVDFEKVTVAEALKHPRWAMGRKVSVDSATLMNKGLEIMEAHWLFGVPVERIDVVIHPESIVHSLVEFVDGNLLAQLGPPDMRYAIQYALTWPERRDGGLAPLDLVKTGALHFQAPEEGRFPCLALARGAARAGGTAPAVLNAANEIAVQRFLDGGISFAGIGQTVDAVLKRHRPVPQPTLDEIVAADAWGRQEAEMDCGAMESTRGKAKVRQC